MPFLGVGGSRQNGVEQLEKEVRFWKQELDKSVNEKNQWLEKYARSVCHNEISRAEVFLLQQESASLKAQLQASKQRTAEMLQMAASRTDYMAAADFTPAVVKFHASRVSPQGQQALPSSHLAEVSKLRVRLMNAEEDAASQLRETEAQRNQCDFLKASSEAYQREANLLREKLLTFHVINDDTAEETVKVLQEMSLMQQANAQLRRELSIKDGIVQLLQQQLCEAAASVVSSDGASEYAEDSCDLLPHSPASTADAEEEEPGKGDGEDGSEYMDSNVSKSLHEEFAARPVEGLDLDGKNLQERPSKGFAVEQIEESSTGSMPIQEGLDMRSAADAVWEEPQLPQPYTAMVLLEGMAVEPESSPTLPSQEPSAGQLPPPDLLVDPPPVSPPSSTRSPPPLTLRPADNCTLASSTQNAAVTLLSPTGSHLSTTGALACDLQLHPAAGSSSDAPAADGLTRPQPVKCCPGGASPTGALHLASSPRSSSPMDSFRLVTAATALGTSTQQQQDATLGCQGLTTLLRQRQEGCCATSSEGDSWGAAGASAKHGPGSCLEESAARASTVAASVAAAAVESTSTKAPPFSPYHGHNQAMLATASSPQPAAPPPSTASYLGRAALPSTASTAAAAAIAGTVFTAAERMGSHAWVPPPLAAAAATIPTGNTSTPTSSSSSWRVQQWLRGSGGGGSLTHAPGLAAGVQEKRPVGTAAAAAAAASSSMQTLVSPRTKVAAASAVLASSAVASPSWQETRQEASQFAIASAALQRLQQQFGGEPIPQRSGPSRLCQQRSMAFQPKLHGSGGGGAGNSFHGAGVGVGKSYCNGDQPEPAPRRGMRAISGCNTPSWPAPAACSLMTVTTAGGSGDGGDCVTSSRTQQGDTARRNGSSRSGGFQKRQLDLSGMTNTVVKSATSCSPVVLQGRPTAPAPATHGLDAAGDIVSPFTLRKSGDTCVAGDAEVRLSLSSAVSAAAAALAGSRAGNAHATAAAAAAVAAVAGSPAAKLCSVVHGSQLGAGAGVGIDGVGGVARGGRQVEVSGGVARMRSMYEGYGMHGNSKGR